MKRLLRAAELVCVIVLFAVCGSGDTLCAALSCLIHEVAHVVSCRITGARLYKAGVTFPGLRLTYSAAAVSYKKELLVILSGASANIAAAVILAAVGQYRLSAINLTLAAVNLLPVNGLDGGEALALVTEYFFGVRTSQHICDTVSFIISLILWTAVIYYELRLGTNVGLLVFSVFITLRAAYNKIPG